MAEFQIKCGWADSISKHIYCVAIGLSEESSEIRIQLLVSFQSSRICLATVTDVFRRKVKLVKCLA